MWCPTCSGEMVLMRTVTNDEIIELDEHGADVSVIEVGRW
jgi:hypothetical protein